jgi:c-di-GMP-binding flagellar brake protein YcgR
MPQKERRKHHRAKVVWPVIMENNRNIISGETQDISAGGAYIRCRKPLKPAEVSMYVSVSLLSPRIRAMAEVVRLDVLGSYNGVEYYGIGVRFVAISDEGRELISLGLQDTKTSPPTTTSVYNVPGCQGNTTRFHPPP